MIDLGCETDDNNEICLIRFALCIIKALRLARTEPCSGTVVTRFLLHSLLKKDTYFNWQHWIFKNLCVESSVTSDHGSFSGVPISASADAHTMHLLWNMPSTFFPLGVVFIQVKLLATDITKIKLNRKIVKSKDSLPCLWCTSPYGGPFPRRCILSMPSQRPPRFRKYGHSQNGGIQHREQLERPPVRSQWKSSR